ncbi:MAG: phosphatidate cytidylyltransferase [Candidatus Tectomicrobia bacterium]|nr:phosphatidate cytidylyltransferase [Candidatus Tectomicrobia bacterium]
MKRILSGVIFLPPLYALIQYGSPHLFFFVFLVIMTIGLLEFYTMIEKGGATCSKRMGLFCSWLIAFSFFLDSPTFALFSGTFTIIFLLLPRFFLHDDLAMTIREIMYTFFGVMYVAWLMSHLVFLRKLEDGKSYLFFVFLVTWAGDTAAYYIGSVWGHHPLSPRISPRKSIEGGVAGFCMSFLMAYLARQWFFQKISLLDTFTLGAILSLMGQLGDLAESLIKRGSGAKDSGSLIPGHGGILDRMDSLMFAVPTVYYYALFFLERS